jgi:hypothetical protein
MGGLKVNGLMYVGYPRWKPYIKLKNLLEVIMVRGY